MIKGIEPTGNLDLYKISTESILQSEFDDIIKEYYDRRKYNLTLYGNWDTIKPILYWDKNRTRTRRVEDVPGLHRTSYLAMIGIEVEIIPVNDGFFKNGEVAIKVK